MVGLNLILARFYHLLILKVVNFSANLSQNCYLSPRRSVKYLHNTLTLKICQAEIKDRGLSREMGFLANF